MSNVRTAAIALTATAAALLTAMPAHADESGISNGISIVATGKGGYVRNVTAGVSTVSTYLSFHGYFRVFGPDYSSVSPTQKWAVGIIYSAAIYKDYADGQKHCVEGWEKQDDGTFALLGRPCVENPI
ncbi:hypothetical protein [Lentzea sp. CA-135723]|uniref:hypothetical protein n=1 Tax=Lentzea sp. CA-135723 TaxID=3239950 RepID=UPI003D89BD2C